MLALAAIAAPLALAAPGRDPGARASVIGGRPAAQGAFPSAAYILDLRGKLLAQCTGTVVAPSLVLTAGHCAENMKTGIANGDSGYRVLTGVVDFATGQGQLSRVVGVIPYPGFARRLEAGDAALLVLDKPVSAPPMTLAKRSQAHLFDAGTRATIAGWGLTSVVRRKLTRHLQFADTVVQPASWCARHVRPFFPRWELCTIDSAHYAASGCYGDSGGPLMVPGAGAGETLEVGIVAFGQARCSPRFPSVYTRVDALTGWLGSWIAAYGSPAARAPGALATGGTGTAAGGANAAAASASVTPAARASASAVFPAAGASEGSGLSLLVQRFAGQLLPARSPQLQLEQILAIVIGGQQGEALLHQLALIDRDSAELGGEDPPPAHEWATPDEGHGRRGAPAVAPVADDLVADVELPFGVAGGRLIGEVAVGGQLDRLGGAVQAGEETDVAVQLVPR